MFVCFFIFIFNFFLSCITCLLLCPAGERMSRTACVFVCLEPPKYILSLPGTPRLPCSLLESLLIHSTLGEEGWITPQTPELSDSSCSPLAILLPVAEHGEVSARSC